MSYLKILNLNLIRLQDSWTAYDRRTETKNRERERERPNGTPVIAQTWWKKLLHKFLSLTLNRLLFLWMSYFKWIHIVKKWFRRFFPCSGMKLEFLFSTGIKWQSSVVFLDRNN